jgi:2-methylcitrate dehydratase PrpD
MNIDVVPAGPDLASGSPQYALQPLAQWAADVTAADIPVDVLTQAKWCVLDTVGVVLAASSDPAVRQVIRAERVIDQGDQARVFISGERFSIPVAGRINAFAASTPELADNVSVHANESNVPLALAYGESHQLSGLDVLTSIVVGDEVARRVHDTYFRGKKSQRDFPVGIPSALNTVGSGVTAARLLRQDGGRMFDTTNVALNLIASALDVTVLSGRPLKPMLFSGWAVYSGYAAAVYAQNGITAADDSFESDSAGWLHGAAHEWELGELTRDLGARWELARPDRKRHASCGFSHAALDGSLQLLDAGDFELADIERIRVQLFPFAFETVGVRRGDPRTANAAKFDLYYLIATALTRRDIIRIADTDEAVLPTRLSDPAVRGLMDKIQVEPDPDITLDARFSARVTFDLSDGRSRELFVKDARGKGANQLTEHEIHDKFRSLATPVLGEARAEQVRVAVDAMDQLANVRTLVDLLVL